MTQVVEKLIIVGISVLFGYIAACIVFVLDAHKKDKAIEKEISKGRSFKND